MNYFTSKYTSVIQGTDTALRTEGSVNQNEFVLQQLFKFCFAFEISRNMT